MIKTFVIATLMMCATTFAQPKIRVTNGKVVQKGDRFEINTSSSRFDFEDEDSENLSVQVEYHGATDEISKLGSGSVVSQVALKLRSENQCNLVYVARRFEPKSEIVVMIKENEGQSTHKECGNRGYERVASVKVPAVKDGDRFSLGGSFDGDELTVRYNGEVKWKGEVRWNKRGKSGIRTDNAKVSVVLN